MHKCKCRNYSPVCLFLLARVEITHTCVYFCACVQKLLTRVFRSARACGFCSRFTGAESSLNGCKEAVIPAFPLHFFILTFVITLFLYINVCNVH